MTNPSAAPPDDGGWGGAPPVLQTAGAQAMDATPSCQKKSEPKGPGLVEKTIKFRFTRANQHDVINLATIHLYGVQLV